MSTVTIRKATLEDLPILLEFEQGIIQAERPYDSTLKEDPISYYSIKDLIVDEDTAVLVAVIEGALVGSGYAVIKQGKPYCKHDEFAYLGFMFTDPNYRGMGINAKIIAGLKGWAKEKGVFEIRLTVYDDNIGAIKAYEKVGFTKHIVEMRIAE